MSITDELREWANELICHPTMLTRLTAIADNIDAEHQKAEDEWKAKNGDMWLKGYSVCHEELMEGHPVIAASLEEAGWVKLPVDADGVPIHVGDVMDEQLPFGGYAAPAPVDTMELSRGVGGYGWMVKLDAENGALISPKLLRHHHAPTVEDVLREFTRDWCNAACAGDMTNAERDAARADTIAEYAAKLMLKEE